MCVDPNPIASQALGVLHDPILDLNFLVKVSVSPKCVSHASCISLRSVFLSPSLVKAVALGPAQVVRYTHLLLRNPSLWCGHPPRRFVACSMPLGLCRLVWVNFDLYICQIYYECIIWIICNPHHLCISSLRKTMHISNFLPLQLHPTPVWPMGAHQKALSLRRKPWKN